MREPLYLTLVKARRAANLSQSAAAAKIGVSPSCLANLESDPRRKPSYETLSRMIEIYKLDPRLLFEDDWKSGIKGDSMLATTIRTLAVEPALRWEILQKLHECGVASEVLTEAATCLGVVWTPIT